jgi:prolipoprotein diacylglyceryl transferase
MHTSFAYIPSPSMDFGRIGLLTLHGNALVVIAGIVSAVWLGERRWAAQGGTQGLIMDIAVWTVPLGIVGARIYHIATNYHFYIGHGKNPVEVVEIWHGGLDLWGALAAGSLGAAIACHRRGVRLLIVADVVAPGIAVGQAIGRWGNWFNQELYGHPSTQPWAVKIDAAHRPRLPSGALNPRYADLPTYQPTFLYESLWCLAVAGLVILIGRRADLTHGRAFALYLAAFAAGHAWAEALRVDTATRLFGLRYDHWTALLVFLSAMTYLVMNRSTRPLDDALYGKPRPTNEAANSSPRAVTDVTASPGDLA